MPFELRVLCGFCVDWGKASYGLPADMKTCAALNYFKLVVVAL